MMLVIMVIHVIICLGLITLVLIQRGRGGGLVEAFSGVESMFGTKTNAFLTRATTVLSTLFFITCLSLAILSARQSKSLMRNIKAEESKEEVAEELPEAVEEQASKGLIPEGAATSEGLVPTEER